MAHSRLLSRCLVLLLLAPARGFSSPSTRRAALDDLRRASLAPFVTVLPPPVQAVAADATTIAGRPSTPIAAAWTSVDGLYSLDEEKKFVTFDKSAYQAMALDMSRTPQFTQAIVNRLKSGEPNSQVVLDLGTGPFAVFAVTAAQNGAKKVYAIEASREAAASAREEVKRQKLEDKITVLEGFSTDVTLPGGEKADFAVAEIVGSVASEEGAYATILDAHRRLVKEPADPASWIPNRIQTFAAPASYSLQNLFRPPAFDWTKLNGEPVRFNCRDEGLQLLADPVVVEDISFADIEKRVQKKATTFTVDDARVEDNIKKFNKEYVRGRVGDADELAITAANSFSGMALWPRLILDDAVEVNSRQYPNGDHQKSHWQTVLPLMAPEPVAVKGGDRITVAFDFNVSSEVTKPSSYKISGNVVSI